MTLEIRWGKVELSFIAIKTMLNNLKNFSIFTTIFFLEKFTLMNVYV